MPETRTATPASARRKQVEHGPFAIPGFGHIVIYQGYPATTNTCGTTPSSGRADRLAGYNHRPGDSGRRCRAISRLIVSFRHVASPRWGAGMFRTGCIVSLCGESPGPESGPLGSPGRSSRRVSACDAEGGDRIEVAQLLRGEAVAGTVPAGHVEA